MLNSEVPDTESEADSFVFAEYEDSTDLRQYTHLGRPGGYSRSPNITAGVDDGVSSDRNVSSCAGCGEGLKLDVSPHWMCMSPESTQRLRNRALDLPQFRDLVYNPWADTSEEGVLKIDVEPPATSLLKPQVHWQQDVKHAGTVPEGSLSMHVIAPAVLHQNVHMTFRLRNQNDLNASLRICDTFGSGFDLTLKSTTCLDNGESTNVALGDFHRRQNRYTAAIESSKNGPVLEGSITHYNNKGIVVGMSLRLTPQPNTTVAHAGCRTTLFRGVHVTAHARKTIDWGSTTATTNKGLMTHPRVEVGAEWMSALERKIGSFTKGHIGGVVDAEEGSQIAVNAIHFFRTGLGVRGRIVSDLSYSSIYMTLGVACQVRRGLDVTWDATLNALAMTQDMSRMSLGIRMYS
ncbi:hypothetical protein SARC_07791 [Sphaeroforma arctica JP610]|uniref:Uncharacterized protein n=1 Tax=Sphaeroforma arctica JP610 TaxID=667725 RepID=A0A0L0FTD9_9EUKA|nr:hypothetical protein SARC_07791 [Sphaeroforma arctica JP610]KNC79831.1 hypothetical protein SARC_07791 [Sphaeroforma arctica JP610]|eukprot:XP_014153733.1 hypothetical protein SARC_07791 [Sphaeroforma arctica JP610]